MEEIRIILKIFEIREKHEYYGYKRITIALSKESITVNKKKVLKIMQKYDLLVKKRRKKKNFSFYKVFYITSRLGINLIKMISINKPFQVIHTDFTELITISGKYYLIVYLCHYSKYVIGWDIGFGPSSEIALKALKPVLKHLNKNSYIHQDQGSCYTSDEYIDYLIKNNLYISYSDKAKPSDNGEIESFFGRFKKEQSSKYFKAKNIDELKEIIDKAIHYYNHDRIHTSIKDIPYNFLSVRLFSQKTV